MEKVLRDYQLEDALFLSQFKGAGCFNEQRTGKTPTALKIMEIKGTEKNLIIVPASALYIWKEEYEYWLKKPCTVVDGTIKRQHKRIEDWQHGLVISYDTLKETKRSLSLVDEILSYAPGMVTLDEAHRIRNVRTATARAAIKCDVIPNRLALTGTPAPSKPYDIWAILHWLHPELYKSYWNWIEANFQHKLQTNYTTGGKFMDIGGFYRGKEILLQQELAKYCTQRKRKEVMPWLPDKDLQPVKLPPTREQLKYLDDLANYFETKHIITKGILDRLIRYRQICLHPALLELPGSSPKIAWIKSYLADYPDESVIIFSKFTKFIEILEKELTRISRGVIIGSTPPKIRKEYVQAFQNKQIKVLILQIDAGKEALTLDTADAAIFTDKYPPVGDIEQAEDRLVATTEDKKDKPHKIFTLMMKGTYDERIQDQLAERKTELDIINDFRNYFHNH